MKHVNRALGTAIANFERARYTRQQRAAEDLERKLRRVMHPSDAARVAAHYAALVSDPADKTEAFVMLTPTQNAAVIRWLRAHSKRPIAAIVLWGELYTVLHPSTGEIMLSRANLADRLDIEPDNVSRIMTELASINAVIRRKEGRRVVYFMNPAVATHIPGPEARREAREKAGPLRLVEGGRADG